MTGRISKWCGLCRDEGDQDDMLSCCGCRKRFHTFCLYEDEQIKAGDKLDPDTWVCRVCTEEDDADFENDEKCRICREEKTEDRDLLLLCDGCPNSYHMTCLGLEAEPDVEKWYCPECRPQDHTSHDVRRLGCRTLPLDGSSIHVNSTSCYICQQPGKLLGCDVCERSFHPSCLPDVEFNNIVDIWECPVCKGDDPLDKSHTRFKRMNMKERQAMRKKREVAIHQMKAKCSRYKNRFILANSPTLAPFVDIKVLESVLRKFKEVCGDKSWKPKLGGKNLSFDSTDLERFRSIEGEAEDDANEFVNKCYTRCERIQTRTMKGPLRKGISLKHYQEDGVEWLLKAFLKGGGILADEMGLGKTIQTLTFLSYLKAAGVDGPHLIVVPLSTVGNWLREVHKFTPNLTTVKICGSKSERDHAMKDTLASTGLYDLYVTTYETVKTEESFFTDTVSYWQCIILDEAHRIKNQSGAMRHSLDRVRGNTRILLTGTPIQNNVQELFTLINFLFPDLFGSKTTALVEAAFANCPKSGPGRKKSGVTKSNITAVAKSAVDVKPEDISAVRSLLETIMLRRVKEQAITLPPKIFHDIWLPIASVAVQWYRKLLALSSMQANTDTSVRKLLGIVIKLRILCCHPKGVVSRENQRVRLLQAFAEETDEIKNAVVKEAEELRSMKGPELISSSAKVSFLDSLLCQLHYENCHNIPHYTEQYMNHRYQLATKQYHADIETSSMYVEGSYRRNFLKKETISEIQKSEEFQNLVYHGIPKDTPTARTEDFFASGLYPVKNLPPPLYTSSRRQRLSKAKMDEQTEKAGLLSGLNSDDGKDSADNSVTEVSRASTGSTASNKENVTKSSDGDLSLLNRSDADIEDNTGKKKDAAPGSCDTPNGADTPIAHKVLIFTQFQLVLDELAEYCQYRGWKYMRLDGSTNKLIRELDMREFSLPESSYFVYLISTRAGGLGINLVAANHVVLFDEDWNPFVDLQAIDRAHRIGQRREVHIWKLTTEWTVEERMAFRRNQKLQLDEMLIQANEGLMAVDDADAEAPEEKLSVEEIKRLLQHGKKAISTLDVSPNQFDNYTLNGFIERERRPLPDGDQLEREEPSVLEDDDKMLSLDAAMHDEADEPDVHNPRNSPQSGEDDDNMISESCSGAPTPELEGSEVKEDQLQLWRSGRVRKKPTNVYTPAVWGTVEFRRKLVYETKCFLCNRSKNAKCKYTDKNNREIEIDYGELIGCSRCPKVYHKVCEGMKDEKRSWTCRWHECCLCFRKSSQCGNLLIHCAKCPNSFCYDCFPPDYTRHNVEEDYYHQLRQRGGTMSSTNWVLFLCARCKAIEEQSKRRALTKAELDDQRQKQKELRVQLEAPAVNTQKPERGFKNELQQQRIVSRRSEIDALENRLENDLRNAYEALFPQNLVEALRRHKHQADQERCAQKAALDASTSSSPTEVVQEFQKCVNENVGEGGTTSPSDNITPQPPQPVSNNSSSNNTRRKKTSIPRVMLPKELLKLCANCHIPFHTHPTDVTEDCKGNLPRCPYPPETLQYRALSSAPGIELNEKNERVDKNPPPPNGLPESMYYHNRSFCSLCGCGQKGRSGHCRRHCDRLSPDEIMEYVTRYAKCAALIEKLRQATPLESSPYDESLQKTRSLMNSIISKVNSIVKDAMRQVGLAHCIAPAPTPTVFAAKPDKGNNPADTKKRGGNTPAELTTLTKLTGSDNIVQVISDSTDDDVAPAIAANKRFKTSNDIIHDEPVGTSQASSDYYDNNNNNSNEALLSETPPRSEVSSSVNKVSDVPELQFSEEDVPREYKIQLPNTDSGETLKKEISEISEISEKQLDEKESEKEEIRYKNEDQSGTSNDVIGISCENQNYKDITIGTEVEVHVEESCEVVLREEEEEEEEEDEEKEEEDELNPG